MPGEPLTTGRAPVSDVPPLERRSSPGFFGKMPSRGDFVSRRLATDFARGWDAWLQRGIAASDAALGAAWLDVYLTSPIWRFALSPGLCGEEAQVGVLMPSVDRVGRYFPLVVAAACGRAPSTAALAADFDAWYGDVEELLLATLAEPPLDLDAFDERLARLEAPAPLRVDAAPAVNAGATGGRDAPRWHCAVPASRQAGELLVPPLAHVLGGVLGAYALWWTQGSERVAPCVLVTTELPAPEAFVALLDGRWRERGWTSAAFEREGGLRARRRWALRSAAITDCGLKRTVNEDAYACRDDLGAWLVADGLGGHQAGDVASRMVTSVLGQLSTDEDVRARVQQLAAALGAVNGCLRVLAERELPATTVASTVAALLVDDSAAACVWAGDSRVYRLRGGELRQLSRDHAEDALDADNPAVTRAVGGPERLELDIEWSDVRAGDRYLLCTDGLYGELGAEVLLAALSLADPAGACAELQAAVLSGAARDNLTAIVVHVDDGSPRAAAGRS